MPPAVASAKPAGERSLFDPRTGEPLSAKIHNMLFADKVEEQEAQPHV